jgi:hypothetical protein
MSITKIDRVQASSKLQSGFLDFQIVPLAYLSECMIVAVVSKRQCAIVIQQRNK